MLMILTKELLQPKPVRQQDLIIGCLSVVDENKTSSVLNFASVEDLTL